MWIASRCSLVGGGGTKSPVVAFSGVLVGREDGKVVSHKGGEKLELNFSFQEMQVRAMHAGGPSFGWRRCHVK